VDLYFLLPVAVHGRFQADLWNRQSALLQEVKEVLTDTYPDTDMSGDGQVDSNVGTPSMFADYWRKDRRSSRLGERRFSEPSEGLQLSPYPFIFPLIDSRVVGLG
jgi:hypothetical protein